MTTSTGRVVRTGSIVTVVALPPGVETLEALSQRVFEAIIGHRFRITAVTIEQPRWAELAVDRVARPATGFESVGHTVWLEPECIA